MDAPAPALESTTEALSPPPEAGRIHRAARPIRLSDRDAQGRLRLDAIARYLQDVAGDDVDETGWGAPEHLWVLRRIRVDVIRPFLDDRAVELATWCCGLAPVAAGRRTSLVGDRGGQVEVDSAWVHLGPDARPARLDDTFGVYAEAAGGRRVSTRLELSDPPVEASRTPWPLRVTDVDLLGHVNNAAYWHAVEQALARAGPDPARPVRAELDYRSPIDLGETVELVAARDEAMLLVGLAVDGALRAVGRVVPLA
jgi:acyl-ACP thioesterase